VSTFIRILLSLPQILSALKEIAAWVDRWNRERAVEKGKQAVDETTRTGTQTAEEKALGGVGGTPSHTTLPGVQERAAKSRG